LTDLQDDLGFGETTAGAKIGGRSRRTALDQPTRITRLQLANWRNFTRLEADLSQRVILVGPNASGKSNLLDAIRFLQDLVAVGGGFQEAVGRRNGVSRLRSLSARRYPDVGIQVSIGNDHNLEQWTYEIAFGQTNQRAPIITKERVKASGTVVLDRPNDRDRSDPARLGQTFLEQVNVNEKFRGVADFLRSVRYLHIVPQLVRDPDRSIGRRDTPDPFGGDFLEQIASTNARTLAARLRRIRDALKVAVPQLKELELWRDTRGTPHLRGRYEHWRPQGAWQTEEEFSDGTLRLMGLLWAFLQGDGPLLLEEPELSLHPDVIRYVPQMLARVQSRTGRQVILSTHSPDLLRDRDIHPDEVLLLQPKAEGTTVRSAADFGEVVDLLDGGLPLADAVLPLTRPKNVQQLALFGD
jgi:predicted ATPase